MSRISDGKVEELPINNYFPYGRMIAFLRVEAPRYAHLVDYLDEVSQDIVTKKEETPTLTKSTILWYTDFINYLALESYL